jgi:coenzyme F420-reducing hydrogenase beta subunit
MNSTRPTCTTHPLLKGHVQSRRARAKDREHQTSGEEDGGATTSLFLYLRGRELIARQTANFGGTKENSAIAF